MKKSCAAAISIVFALQFFSLSFLYGQDKYIPAAYRERVNVLYQKVKTELVPMPIVPVPCPLESLQNSYKEMRGAPAQFNNWWDALHQMRDNGEKNCCFSLIKALEPLVQNDKAAYLKWLYEKSVTLNYFQFKDSAFVVAQYLKTEANKNKLFQGWSAIAEARANSAKRQFDATMHLAETALNYARQDNDKRLEMKALSMMGNTSRDIYINKPEKSVPFHETALHIAETLKDTSSIIYQLNAIAICYDQTDTEKVFDYTEGAIAYLKPSASLADRMDCIRMLTIYLHTKKDYDRTVPLYLHTIELLKRLGDSSLAQNTYEQVACIYLEQKQYHKALVMMDSASVYSDFKAELGYFYRTYADIHNGLGNTQKAIEYYQKAFDEQVNGYDKRNSALLTEMETRLRTRETEILLEQQQRQRWLLFGLVALLCLLTGGAIYAYLKKEKANKEIEAQHNLIEKQANELRHLDEAKTRFFANVSHELRTPLTLILGPLASMLKRNRLENTDFTYTKTAQTHAKDLLKLVNEILDLSKMESGKMQVHEETVSFQPFIRRLVSAFESHAERLGIHYQFDYRASKRLRLVVDTEKITRIVNNLLSNAMKFTHKGGSVTIVVDDLANTIRLSVHDTGRGIHPDDLPSVFDRFYQTNQADAPVEGGTGIGLALCREFAEVLKGKIWVESQLGEGSQFYFEFPKKEVLGVGDNEEWAAHTEGDAINSDLQNLKDFVNLPTVNTNNPTLLIVEDNPDLRAYIASILRGANYNILEAENGLEALDVLQNCINSKAVLPKLIVSDIMMPVMDGFQLLKVLKDRDYFRSIPVVMLTARADIKDKLNALRIGVDDYLLKPFEEEELLARVENLLRNYQGRIVNEEEPVDKSELMEEEMANDTLTVLHSPVIHQKDVEWLIELERVVALSMSKSDFNTEGVAEKLFMGRSQFFKKVKQLTGITPNEYVQEMRLNQARTLLENRQTTTVKEAAFSVGFKDVRYFSELFKKRFGKLPSEYLS